jgi:hypothetical protein
MNTGTVTGPLECLVGRLRRKPEDDGGPSRMDMLREREEAADEIERLQADAARYRWLRDNHRLSVDRYGDLVAGRYMGDAISRADLDAAIDAAMQADQPPNAS